MASRELSLKGNDIIVQAVLKRTPLSSPVKDSDSNSNDAAFRPSNLAIEAENSFTPSLLGPLKPRSSILEKTSPPATSAPFGPTILDKLITKNKLQSMKEAELRKDKNEVVTAPQDVKTVDPQVLEKRKMMAYRLRNPFVTKRRKKFKRKMNQQEASKQEGSKQKRLTGNASPSSKKNSSVKDSKIDTRIAANRARRRLNSESSSSLQSKKSLRNKSRPLKQQSKMSNVEALKQSSKMGRNNRYSTRSDSPVLRNGKRRKCDEMSLDLYDIDTKRKKLTRIDLASVKSDGMSDEQCSYVTASESDICSFLDLETSSQNLDVKEESCDSTFKLEIPTSPSVDGDEGNANMINLKEPFKGIGASPMKVLKKERCSVEQESKSLDGFDAKSPVEVENYESLKSEVVSPKVEIDPNSEEAEQDFESLDMKDAEKDIEEVSEDDTAMEKDYVNEEKSEDLSFQLNCSNETVVLDDSSASDNVTTTGELSSNRTKEPNVPKSSSREVCQGRKFRSASLNDSCCTGVTFTRKRSSQKDDEELKSSDSDEHEVSFTADNSQFELFVEREYKRGQKKRSSSDTSLQRLQNTSDATDIKFKLIRPIPEDEKSSDANGPFSDEKENEFYEKYITEESTSEEASCSSSQVSEHPKITDKEFSSLEEMNTKNDNDLKENDEQQAVSESKQDQSTDDGLSTCENNKPPCENPEAQAMKESILGALGLQSASMQAASKTKPKDKYTGTLKAVIKLNRNADKKSAAGRMVFKQKDTSNVGGKSLEYRICSELAPGTENVPLTHLKDIVVNSISKKAHSKPKSHFDLSGPLNEVDLEVAQVKKADDSGDGSTAKEGEPKKALVIPEKSSSFSIHPERLCSDVCSYCHGKFGSLDTPCHIGQIKNSERRSKILSIEILLTKDSCLCDACFRYVDRRANCPSFKAQTPRPQKRQPLSDAVCSVQGCGQPANHSVRRKWIVKLKKSIAKKLMIDMEKIQHNQHLPFPLCSQHYYWVDYFTVCGICKKRLSRNNMYALGPEAEELNQYLHEDGIPVHLTDKLFLCKLCRYYSSLRLKYKDLSLMTPGHKTYFRSYRRKILQYHDIEVSESEEDIGSKSAEDESADHHQQGKVRRRKGKKSASDEIKKAGPEEKPRPNLSSSQGCNYVDPVEGQSEVLAPTIDYSALDDNPDVGFNNIASLLSGRDQPECGNQARIQVKFGNLNIGKLANLNIGQDARTNSSAPRPPYLPGEQDLPLKADMSFQSNNKKTTWERCVSTIQFDKDTKQLWQELQRPYGNASSFMRHLVMLEKHWRSGSLVLVDNPDPRAAKYVNSVRNRVDSFERNFKTPTLSTILSKPPVQSPSPNPPANVPSVVSGTSAETDVAPPKLSDSSDKCDKLVSKSDAPQVPPVTSAVVNEISTCVTVSTPSVPVVSNVPTTTFSHGTSTPKSTTSTPCYTTSGPSFTTSATTSALVQSLNAPSAIPIVNLVNLNSNTSNSNTSFSPSISFSNPSISFSNPSISFPNSSVSLSRTSASPNVSYASLASVPASSSPSVSLILPPNLSTSLPSSLQNTLINFDRNNISLNQFSAPNISISPSPSLKTSPSLSIAPKPNFPRQPRPQGAISKLLTGNKSMSSPNNVSGNLQMRRVAPMDPSQFKVRKPKPPQRQVSKIPPQLLRFPGPSRPSVPGLELIVPKSFTMQTKTIPGSSQGGSRPRMSAPTQGIMENLALLRQYRSLKPKPIEPKPSGFNPMICDVRSLASTDTDGPKPAAAGSMPKIPKALTITQVSQPGGLPRSVTVSLEKKPNQIPAAFLGGEKPSVSVFCEVNPPP
ncbi:unnamed protein product [Bemisia tabaci]|uniref:Uncharacterized protein n=1 Tax=Bemisia tabaci TaxID=7038 RepID=A0A9P0AA90_BEMTA|nr:unnamed protein product [Bemisia tabaci]